MIDIQDAADQIRSRSKRTRILAMGSVIGIVFVVVALIYYFVGASHIEIKGDLASTNLLIFLISTSIVRIGAVLLGISLTQVLANFSRYLFRTADHLDATADAIEIAGDDSADIAAFISALSPKHIDFGKPPSSPSEQIFDAIKEIASKIPSK